MSEHIPLVDLKAQQDEITPALWPDLDRILATTAFVGGKDVDAFEDEYAEFVGARFCVGVANGTDAVELALRALGIGSGDEVILPANTFIATAEAVVRAGATPVLVDVDDACLLMDPDAVATAVTPRTQAVIPVHLYGQPADVESLRRALPRDEIRVVEDAAQSQGASRWGIGSGALADIAATSFYPGKNLGAAGDAGGVTTDDPDLAMQVRRLANHGSTKKYVHDVVGFNSRLDTIQAAVLRHKLRALPRWNEMRREAAERYADLLGHMEKVQLPTVLEGNVHVWHLYVVRVPDRDNVLAQLHEKDIGAGLHYPFPLHLTEAFASLGKKPGSFPVAERSAREILSLPMFPHITADQQARIAEALRVAIGA